MNLLARLFGVKTDIGGDVNLANVVLIMVSLLAGFGISYCLVHLADASKRKQRQACSGIPVYFRRVVGQLSQATFQTSA